MAIVKRRRYTRRVSTVHLLDGTVTSTHIQRCGSGTDTVEISVYDIDETEDERDRLTRYVFDLTRDELEKLLPELQSHFASMT